MIANKQRGEPEVFDFTAERLPFRARARLVGGDREPKPPRVSHPPILAAMTDPPPSHHPPGPCGDSPPSSVRRAYLRNVPTCRSVRAAVEHSTSDAIPASNAASGTGQHATQRIMCDPECRDVLCRQRIRTTALQRPCLAPLHNHAKAARSVTCHPNRRIGGTRFGAQIARSGRSRAHIRADLARLTGLSC
jgi:hypothetical protein